MDTLLFLLKSSVILCGALLICRLAVFSAAHKHVVLSVALLCLPLLLLMDVMPKNTFDLATPAGLSVLDAVLEFPLPEFSTNTQSHDSAGSRAVISMHDVLVGIYLLVAGILILAWVIRLTMTYRWIGETQEIDASQCPQKGVIINPRMSPLATAPMAWGIFRPEIIVPAQWSSWSNKKRLAVLHHEQEHVRRRDILVANAAGLICALFWFQPLVWVARKRLAMEAEHACDDAVIGTGISAFDYANQLIEIARDYRPGVALFMAKPATLPIRIHALLNNDTRRTPMSYRQIVPIFSFALAVVFGLSSIHAKAEKPTDDFSLSVSSEVMAIFKTAAEYPPAAMEQGIEGYVLVEFTVDEQGATADAFIVKSEPAEIFDEAALQAVTRFKYKPVVREGVPQRATGIRNYINFKLPKGPTIAERYPVAAGPHIRASTISLLSNVHTAIDEEDVLTASRLMDGVKQQLAEFSAQELAQVHNMAGYVAFYSGNYAKAAGEYEKVLAQGDAAPQGLRISSLYTLAQLNFVIDEYEDSLRYIQQWMQETEHAGPTPRIFMSQIYYQQENYPAAITAMEAGFESARESEVKIRENWLQLLAFLYYEEEQWADAISVLENLVRDHPKPEYETRLKKLRELSTQDA